MSSSVFRCDQTTFDLTATAHSIQSIASKQQADFMSIDEGTGFILCSHRLKEVWQSHLSEHHQ